MYSSMNKNVHIFWVGDSICYNFILSQERPLDWDSVFNPPTSSVCRTEMSITWKLKHELAVHRAGSGHGRLLRRCLDTLKAVPPTSVQPERDFSTLRMILGEN